MCRQTKYHELIYYTLIYCSKPDTSTSENTKLKEMFSRLAGADEEIDPEELQDMLTTALTTGN